MARKTDRKGLGRGLSALLADTDVPATPDQDSRATGMMMVPVENVRANPDQPRKIFSDTDIEELAASIRESGILQPLIVRPDPDTPDQYQLVAGERRWRAAQRAQLHEVPIVVRTLNDEEVFQIGIIENVQRVDLNPIEEATSYRQLIDRFGHSQEQVATSLGKSRSHIANMMRLLTLPEPVMAHVQTGKLSPGHARALITALDPISLASDVIAKGLSVRQTEVLAKTRKIPPSSAPPRQTFTKDADTRALEADLTAQIGLRVIIDHAPGPGGGEVRIRYKDLEQLDTLCRRLVGE